MTTVINNPAPTAVETEGTSTGGISFLIGIIVLVGLVMVFLYFGIPAIQRMGQVQVNIPAPQIIVPNKVDLNVTQEK